MDRQERMQKYGIVRCEYCQELICEDCHCSACGAIFSRQGLIDMLVSMRARTPDPVAV
jgi:hypothetical protein